MSTTLKFSTLNELPIQIQKEINSKFGIDEFNYHLLFRGCIEVIEWMRQNHPDKSLMFISTDDDVFES